MQWPPRHTLIIIFTSLVGMAWLFCHVLFRPPVTWPGNKPTVNLEQAQPIMGVWHVHSNNSHDGHVALSDIAKAAQQAHLNFVVVTDHNVQETAPLQFQDVMLLSFAELSTPSGHVIAFNSQTLPNEQERQDNALLSKLQKAGANPIIAHPTDSLRPWSGSISDAAGLEIANVAAAARKYAGPYWINLGPLLLTYPINPTLTLAQLYQRDNTALTLWDTRPEANFVGFCGVDAHGLISLYNNLRVWLMRLHTSGKPTAEEILQAVSQGHFDCVAGLVPMDLNVVFAAENQGMPVAHSGDQITLNSADTLSISMPTWIAANQPLPQETALVLLRNGAPVATVKGPSLRYHLNEVGTYRAELWLPINNLVVGQQLTPVFYSNRIQVVR